MSDTRLQKRIPSTIKERGQYLVAFGVVASMLVVASMPVFVILFFGVFAFFLYKMFSSGSRSDAREIFEFYLAANEILRDDDRRWYGFELKETIDRGEAIIQRWPTAPPLVYFAVGALYNRIGEHKSAVKYLANIVENPSKDEKAIIYPSPEFRNYVKILRKIERDPSDAPLTSGAVRSLERARRMRASILLEASRQEFSTGVPQPLLDERENTGTDPIATSIVDPEHFTSEHNTTDLSYDDGEPDIDQTGQPDRHRHSSSPTYKDRKPISEVLHDIYDGKQG